MWLVTTTRLVVGKLSDSVILPERLVNSSRSPLSLYRPLTNMRNIKKKHNGPIMEKVRHRRTEGIS